MALVIHLMGSSALEQTSKQSTKVTNTTRHSRQRRRSNFPGIRALSSWALEPPSPNLSLWATILVSPCLGSVTTLFQWICHFPSLLCTFRVGDLRPWQWVDVKDKRKKYSRDDNLLTWGLSGTSWIVTLTYAKTFTCIWGFAPGWCGSFGKH